MTSAFLPLFSSCNKNETPKPYAYARLYYPEADYKSTSLEDCPFRFEYPVFTTPERPEQSKPGNLWFNLRFSPYKALLYMSYTETSSIDSLRKYVFSHESLLRNELPQYAKFRKTSAYQDNDRREGYLYEIDGNTACPLQFIITDKRDRFFRGALIFDQIPDRDSIADILDGMTRDINHIMESFEFIE
jgi:gliding motility-associated lipoprotein GldD